MQLFSTKPTPPTDSPVTRAEFDQLMDQLKQLNRRSIRTETRLVRLMEANGLTHLDTRTSNSVST